MVRTPSPLRQATLEMIRAHREIMDRERRNRIEIVTLARQYGVTNAEIGEALGMTEAGVRQLLKRAEAAAHVG